MIRTQDRHPIILCGIVFFTFVYTFFYQLAFPFNSALFLYAVFGLCIILIVFSGTIKVGFQLLLMLLLLIVSVIGTFYTTNSIEGNREAIILGVMFIYFLANQSSIALNEKLNKVIDIGAVLVLVSVFCQFFFKESFNHFMQGILREDRFEQLMHSFGVDNAFAGFSASTVDAAFFSAVLFGKYAMRLFGFSREKKQQLFFNALMTGLSLFAVFLTSKRGILVGMIAALFLTMMLLNRISKHTFQKILIAVVVIILALLIFYSTNDAAKNFLDRFLVDDGGDISTGRTTMYFTAMSKLFSGNFLFGFGTGATYDLYSAGLHNIYLQVLYDHGILGILPYLFFFGFNLTKAKKEGNSRSMYIQILMLVYGMFGNPIYSNMIFMTYLVQIAETNKCLEMNGNKADKTDKYKVRGRAI